MLTPERRKEIAQEANRLRTERTILPPDCSGQALIDAEAELTRLEERVRELEQAASSTIPCAMPKQEWDIHSWYQGHQICPTCGDNLHQLHPLANLWPHFMRECARPVPEKE